MSEKPLTNEQKHAVREALQSALDKSVDRMKSGMGGHLRTLDLKDLLAAFSEVMRERGINARDEYVPTEPVKLRD